MSSTSAPSSVSDPPPEDVQLDQGPRDNELEVLASRTAVVWRCAICPEVGHAWWVPNAFSALALHVARFHPMRLSSVGSVESIDPVCDPDERAH